MFSETPEQYYPSNPITHCIISSLRGERSKAISRAIASHSKLLVLFLYSIYLELNREGGGVLVFELDPVLDLPPLREGITYYTRLPERLFYEEQA